MESCRRKTLGGRASFYRPTARGPVPDCRVFRTGPPSELMFRRIAFERIRNFENPSNRGISNFTVGASARSVQADIKQPARKLFQRNRNAKAMRRVARRLLSSSQRNKCAREIIKKTYARKLFRKRKPSNQCTEASYVSDIHGRRQSSIRTTEKFQNTNISKLIAE